MLSDCNTLAEVDGTKRRDMTIDKRERESESKRMHTTDEEMNSKSSGIGPNQTCVFHRV